MADKNITADDIIKTAENTLCGEVHALFRAIVDFPHKETDKPLSYTDGSYFRYNSDEIIKRASESQNEISHLILHSLFHCVLLHIFNTDLKNKKLWNLSCDICVEKLINSAGITCTVTPKSERRIFLTRELCKEVKHFTAENIYAYFSQHNLTDEQISSYCDAFSEDDHNNWYELNQSYHSPFEDDFEEVEARSIYKFADDGGTETNNFQNSVTQSQDDTVNSPASESEKWRETAKRIIRDSQNEPYVFGTSRGVDTQILKTVTRDYCDYGEFLKKFTAINEQLEINDDEFDYIYYTYGLSLYGNIPLIEPLEYAENGNIQKLIIAIDTSGSVNGEPVRCFVEKTYNILKTTDFFKHKSEIHILQCDCDIQSADIIHNENELEKYIENITLKGFGGTDFRPVFDYADNLLKNSPKKSLNGVIYFTDGDGSYPEKCPDYKNVFVIYDNGFDESKMPKWAIPLYMNRNELLKNDKF